MYLDVDYYSKQWGLELIDEDLKNIEELGYNIIRIADFAWDVFELKENHYDFTFFDQIIEKYKEYDLKDPEIAVKDKFSHSQLFKDYSAIMVKKYGQGKCYYLVSSFEEKLIEKLFDEITAHKIIKKENEENIVLSNNVFIDHDNFKWELKYARN